jgi:hypothetical protein
MMNFFSISNLIMNLSSLPPCPWGKYQPHLVLKDLSDDDLYWLIQSIVVGKNTVADLRRKYHLNFTSSVYRWIALVTNGQPITRDTGRARILTKMDTEALTSYLTEDAYNRTEEEWTKTVMLLAQANAALRGKTLNSISKRTMGRIEAEGGVKTGVAEETTNARAAGVADQRSTMSFVILNKVMSKVTPIPLLMNVDGTQYTVGNTDEGKCKVKYRDLEKNVSLKVLPQKRNKGGLQFFIKFYLLITANGCRANPIYIIADDTMPPGAIDVYEVGQLSRGS